MQLLLPTAQATARKYGTTVPTSASELYDPRLNIELGTAYMKDQLTKFGRIEYMAVAYNAGPGRVKQWLKDVNTTDWDEFIERLPFAETRLYVKSVLRNYGMYQRLYGLASHGQAAR